MSSVFEAAIESRCERDDKAALAARLAELEAGGATVRFYRPAQAVEARPLILRPCIANNDEGRRHRETRSCKGLGVTFRFGRGRRQVKAGEPSPIGKPDVSTCVPLVIGAFTNVTGSGVQGVCGRLD